LDLIICSASASKRGIPSSELIVLKRFSSDYRTKDKLVHVVRRENSFVIATPIALVACCLVFGEIVDQQLIKLEKALGAGQS
jgi:hypothetical protein